MTKLAIVIGAVIHSERVSLGMTQAHLAKIAGIHPMALSKLERGVQADIGVETIQKLAIPMGMAANEIVDKAESWQLVLEEERVPDDSIKGAALSAFVALSKVSGQCHS